MITIASRKSLAFTKCGNCSLYLGSPEPPNDSDWAEYIAWFSGLMKNAEDIKTLVYERGPGPNAGQRKELRTLVEERDVKVAVVTNSPIARGVMTALTWFSSTSAYRAFPPAELSRAFEFLGLDAQTMASVQDAIDGGAPTSG